MGRKEDVRDWEILEAISSLGKDSFDVVFRDVDLEGGRKADFLRYRSQNYLVECRFYHDGTEKSRSNSMEDLRSAREILDQEAFKPRLRLSNINSMSPLYTQELRGDYHTDYGLDLEEVYAVLGGVLSDEIDELSEIRCKE